MTDGVSVQTASPDQEAGWLLSPGNHAVAHSDSCLTKRPLRAAFCPHFSARCPLMGTGGLSQTLVSKSVLGNQGLIRAQWHNKTDCMLSHQDSTLQKTEIM